MSLLKTLTDKIFGVGAPAQPQVEVSPEPAKPNITVDVKISKKKDLVKADGKLNESDQFKLIDIIAQGLTLSQVKERFILETGISLNVGTISDYKYSPKWREKILELRDHYLSRIDLIDGAHKAVRLRRMEEVFEKAVQEEDFKVAISSNEQIRKEFQSDGDTTINLLNNPTYQQFNTLSNEELIKRFNEATKKLKEKTKNE